MLSNLRRDELLSTSAPVVLCETLRNGAGIQALEAHFPPQVHVFELIPPEGALFDATASPVLTVMDLDGKVLPTPVDKNEVSANKPERWAAIQIMSNTQNTETKGIGRA